MTGELFNPEAFEQMPGQMSMDQDEAVRAFNEMVASWTTPEAREQRARERAEYEARYEAMRARKRWEPPCGRSSCAEQGCCASRDDCPCGIGDER